MTGKKSEDEKLKDCAHCRFWSRNLPMREDLQSSKGECHVGGPSRKDPKWPTTYHHDWCGRFKTGEGEAKLVNYH